MKHPRKLVSAALLLALVGYLYAPPPAPNVAPPTAGDCVELHLWSNGVHSDIAAPAALFPEDHPLRRRFPAARAFLIGWGDEAFYRSDGRSWLMAVDAVIPPSPTALHIAYDAPRAAAYLGPGDDTPIAVSGAGAARFVAFIDRALVLGPDGEAVFLDEGKLRGRSAFLRARGDFHLFNVCNHWIARALRAAGVNVNARAAWFGGPLVREARAAQSAVGATCPRSRPTG